MKSGPSASIPVVGWLPPQLLFGDGCGQRSLKWRADPPPLRVAMSAYNGLRTLRRHLTTVLAQRSIECTEEQIVLTHGASQALELCINALTQPGDSVLSMTLAIHSYSRCSSFAAFGRSAFLVPPVGPDIKRIKRLGARH